MRVPFWVWVTSSSSVAMLKRSSNTTGPYARLNAESGTPQKPNRLCQSRYPIRQIPTFALPRPSFADTSEPRFKSFQPEKVQRVRLKLNTTVRLISTVCIPLLSPPPTLTAPLSRRQPPHSSSDSYTIYNCGRRIGLREIRCLPKPASQRPQSFLAVFLASFWIDMLASSFFH